MTDDFKPANPEFTVAITGPNGREYISVWKKTNKDGTVYWSGKDARGNWVNINPWRSKEEREKENTQTQESSW